MALRNEVPDVFLAARQLLNNAQTADEMHARIFTQLSSYGLNRYQRELIAAMLGHWQARTEIEAEKASK